MKAVIMATITTILLSGAFAQAGYLCQSYDSATTSLKVQKKKYSNRLGANVEISHQVGSSQKHYYGQLESFGGSLFGKQLIKIISQNSTDQLTIVTQAKNCGRGFCDPNDYWIKAELKINNSEEIFYCSEI
jgi:hypothetical protein